MLRALCIYTYMPIHMYIYMYTEGGTLLGPDFLRVFCVFLKALGKIENIVTVYILETFKSERPTAYLSVYLHIDVCVYC